jgi:hypothetical protein
MSTTALLTETADYDTPGSWGTASKGWPEIYGDDAYAMYVFANCVQTIPYGSYVLMDRRGSYNATYSRLRVAPDRIDTLRGDFDSTGRPSPEESVLLREQYGHLRIDGLRERAPIDAAIAQQNKRGGA